MRLVISLVTLWFVICVSGFAQSGTMTTITGLNTQQYGHIGATATPDPTIAVGTLDFCEHVNSAYQCWYKTGPNAFQPVNFLGGTSPKVDSSIWSQNHNNGGNTPNCGTAASPNAEILHDNVYNKWIIQKRILSAITSHEYMCIAVSNIDDVSQSDFGWFAFEWDLFNVIPLNSHGVPYYPDYPQAGLWQTSTSATPPYTPAKDQALWVTYELQDTNNNNNTSGVLVCAVNLAGLESSTSSPYVNNVGTPACVVAHGLSPYTQRDNWIPANNSDTTPPISSDGEMFTYMIEPPHDNKTYLMDPNHTQGVEQWTIDWTASTPTPTEVGSWDLPSTQTGGDQLACFDAASYYDTVCVPQPSTATTGIYIDSVGDRMQQSFHYTANGGQGSVWTSAHAIQITPNSSILSQTEADIRLLQWNSSTPAAISIAADYPVTDPNDPSAYVFLPSIVRDRVGNLQGIWGTSGAGASDHPALDSMYLIPGAGTVGSRGYITNPETDGDAEDSDPANYRWGDWYGGVLDPVDSCTVWVVGEYLPTTRTQSFYWYTAIAELPPMNNCVSSSASAQLSTGNMMFGSLEVGTTSAPQAITLTNNESVALNISSIGTSGDFAQTNNCGSSLNPGLNCTINVTFTPSVLGTRQGSLTVMDDAPNNPQSATLIGTGVASAVTLSPASLTFTPQVLGSSSVAQTITLTNTASGSFSVNSIVPSGDYSETDTCSSVLAPGQKCTISIRFTPSVTGAIPGVITVNDTAPGSPHLIAVSGSGVTAITTVPTNVGFGNVQVNCGSSCNTAHRITLTNNSASSLSLTWNSSGNFTVAPGFTQPCGNALSAGSQCTLSVSFAPTAYAPIKGSVAIGYNGTYSPLLVGLSGVGVGGGSNPLSFSVPSLNMGNVVTGTASPTKVVTVTNSSGGPVNISSIVPSADFGVTPSKTTCGGVLAAGAKCTVGVSVSPTTAGAMLGSLTISDDQTVSPQILDTAATAVWPVGLSPASLSFATQSVGTSSSPQTVTLTNNQSSALTINTIVASGDYSITTASSNPCAAGTIAARATCNIAVVFSPTAAGTINGAITVSYGSPGSPQEVNLTGTAQ